MRWVAKTLLASWLVFFALSTCSATSSKIKLDNFYAGGDFALNKYSYSSTQPITDANKSRTQSLSPFVGFKFHNNFAIEAGYVFLFDIKPITDNSNQLQTNNIYLDIVGLYEIERNFELLASVGTGRMAVDFSGTSHNAFFARAGAGVHYYLDDYTLYDRSLENFSIRVKFNWQKVGRDADLIKNTTSFGMGLIYNF